MKRPDWWPRCPYPESIFPMPREDYEQAVPDPAKRTALSGMLGREFWHLASDAIWARISQAVEEGELVFREPDLGTEDPDATWTLRRIVDQLRWCGYECEAGPLTMNVAFQALERVAEEVSNYSDKELGRHLRFSKEACELRARGWHIAIVSGEKKST